MTDLEGCISYWQRKLFHMKAYLEPSETALIEMTIKFLKELNTIKAGEQ